MIVIDIEKVLKEEIIISEACLTGIFWNDPNLYALYPEDKIDRKTFLNKHWGFFFGLGRYMSKQGVQVFDDISIVKYIKDLGLEEDYEEYGGFETVKEVMIEVYDKAENVDSYYADIKKYKLIKELVILLGEKVIEPNGKYDYHYLNKEQLYTYWNDKIVKLGLDGDAKYDEHHLLKNLDKVIDQWSENPATGLPFYNSKKMTKICTGWDYGNVYINGGFGGSGKTSFSFYKVVMSCIENKEKLLVIANEQSVEEFQKMLLITAMGIIATENEEKGFQRQRINEGNFTEGEKAKLQRAVEWVKKLCEGEEKLITFVFMENYIIEDVKKLMRYYANRGIRRIMIDTGKPSEGSASMARWERFTEDFKEIYKLARKNGGGLDLAVWVNVQLADSALSHRYLNEHAFGDSKKIKNEASVVFMSRPVWDDEYRGGKNELKVINYVPAAADNKFAKDGYVAKTIHLERDKTYYVLFTTKNRRGQDNKTGLKVLVFEVDFNRNTWTEVGWTTIFDDKSY